MEKLRACLHKHASTKGWDIQAHNPIYSSLLRSGQRRNFAPETPKNVEAEAVQIVGKRA